MHPCRPNLKAAFSLIELLVVMAIIMVLAGLLLPSLDRGKARARRVQCVNHLKQLGLCFHAFAHDNNSAFPNSLLPQDVSQPRAAVTHLGGSFYCTPEPFKAVGNDMPVLRLLICPTDTQQPASDLASLRVENLSYFVNTQASYRVPTSILVGDRNLRRDEALARRLQLESGRDVLTWTSEMHKGRGNLLFADGSVHTESRPIMVSAEQPVTNTSATAAGSTPSEAPVLPAASVNPNTGGGTAQPGSTQGGQSAPLVGVRGETEVPIGSTRTVRQVFVPARIHGLEEVPPAATPAVTPAKLPPTSAPASLSQTSAPPPQPTPAVRTGFVDKPASAPKLTNSLWILYPLLLLLLIGLVVCLFRARSIRFNSE